MAAIRGVVELVPTRRSHHSQLEDTTEAGMPYHRTCDVGRRNKPIQYVTSVCSKLLVRLVGACTILKCARPVRVREHGAFVLNSH